jgi:hypothetical protein
MNRLWVRRSALRLLGGAVFAGSCDRPVNGQDASMRFDTNEAWNSPENTEAADGDPPPLHLGDLYPHAPAISPDGSLIALTLPARPVNEVAIFDVAARRGWTLSHPNYRVKLAQPTFSPDGQSLAVVVTPPTYFGISEIWISPLRGGDCRVLAQQPSGCLVLPQFSSDGTRLVCFGDANQSVVSPAFSRSYRTGAVTFAPYEFDLRNGQATRLMEQAWSWVEFIGYARNDDGFCLRTGFPAVQEPDSNGSVRWVMNYDPTGTMRSDRGRHGFFVRRGSEPVFPVESIIPEAARGRAAALVGVSRRGALLVRTSRANASFAAGAASVLIRCLDGVCADWIAPPNVHLQDAAMSGDGNVAIGRVVRLLANGSETVLPEQAQVYLLRDQDGGVQTLSVLTDIDFDPQPRLLHAVGRSEMAS